MVQGGRRPHQVNQRLRWGRGADQSGEAVVEVGGDHCETLLAQQLEHLRVVVNAGHRGVRVPLAQQPAPGAAARAEVDDAARGRYPGQVEDGGEVVAEHLSVEVEAALMVVTDESLRWPVVVRGPVGLVIHAFTVGAECVIGIVSCV